jgi:hypothetical protein
MDGPGHYRTAQAMLNAAASGETDSITDLLLGAQACATLALVAAVVGAYGQEGSRAPDWSEVLR